VREIKGGEIKVFVEWDKKRDKKSALKIKEHYIFIRNIKRKLAAYIGNVIH
jgi:hypothetical protein